MPQEPNIIRLDLAATREEKMKLMTAKFVAATCIALPALLTPALAQQGIKRTALGTVDFPPGYQTVMGLAEIAPGTCSGRHTHPGTDNAYVLEGGIVMKIDGKPDQQFKPGDAILVPEGVPHDGCATAGGVKILTVTIIEKGKPLGSPAP
jgi:quercetin dioxygenase-like cupin family protein